MGRTEVAAALRTIADTVETVGALPIPYETRRTVGLTFYMHGEDAVDQMAESCRSLGITIVTADPGDEDVEFSHHWVRGTGAVGPVPITIRWGTFSTLAELDSAVDVVNDRLTAAAVSA